VVAAIGTTEFVSGTLVVALDVGATAAGLFTELLLLLLLVVVLVVVVAAVLFSGETFCSITVDSVDTTAS
jgi:hypothetical protein